MRKGNYLIPYLLIVIGFMLIIGSLAIVTYIGEDINETVIKNNIEVLESDPYHLKVKFSYEGPTEFQSIKMPDGNTYTAIKNPKGSRYQIGKPDIPAFGVLILVPNGTEPVPEVGYGPPIVYKNINLPPVQPPMPDVESGNITNRFTMDKEAYKSKNPHPGVFAKLERIKVKRGLRYTILWVFPYQFIASEKKLLKYPITVTILFQGQIESVQSNLRCDSYDSIMRRVAINADTVLPAYDESMEKEKPTYGEYGWDYIIYTPEKFAGPANKFAIHKKLYGYKTLVEIVKPGVTASDIKKGLQNAYDTWTIKPKCVLLMGDSESIPPIYQTLHAEYNYYGSPQGYTAADMYYVTMGGATDEEPDIHIGRLSVDTEAQAEARVNGIIDYEENPPLEEYFYNTAAICAYFQDGGKYNLVNSGVKVGEVFEPPDGIDNTRFSQTSEDLAVLLSDQKYGINKKVTRIYYTEKLFVNKIVNKATGKVVEEKIYYINPTHWNDNNQTMQGIDKNFDGLAGKVGDPIPMYLLCKNGFAWNGDASDITNAVMSGCFLLTHRGHGNRQGWGQPRYEWNDVLLWTNFNHLPVVLSFNCMTGWFDNETDSIASTNEESLSEYFERPAYSSYGNCGAVAVIAATRISFSGPNDYLFLGMADAIWPNCIEKPLFGTPLPILEMGGVLDSAKQYLKTKLPDDKYRKTALEEYHLFGDPSMEIRTEKPNYLVASFEKVWPWLLKPYNLIAKVELVNEYNEYLSPAKGAKVIISKRGVPLEDYNQYYTSTTDEEGVAIFPDLVIDKPGEYNIVITASNSIPFEDSFVCE